MSSRRRFLFSAGLASLGAPFAARAQSAPGWTAPPPRPPVAPPATPVPGAGPDPSVTLGPAPTTSAPTAPPPPLVPERLREGDVVGLVTPAGAIFDEAEIREAEAALAGLGLRTKRGPHVLDRHGYLGGQDVSRAADVMTMFRDPTVKAILPLRGGWGCARLLPYLDYDVIRAHPKVVCGYSDVTSLLTALYARAGLVGYHGPVATSTWNAFSTSHFKRTLFWGERVRMAPDADTRVETIVPGVARGRLVGGNLSVLTAILGTSYVPDFTGHLLFLEETNEEPYRVDRMMTQLKLAGVLQKVAGVVFGNCNRCAPGMGYVSLSLRSVLDDHLRALGKPAFYGTMIGHITDKFTVPVGVEAEMDATAGTIRLLESPVA